jgi:hypothetical protein
LRSAFLAVLLLVHAVTAAQERPLPELEPFLKEVRERLQTDRTLQSSYSYVETRRELKLDKQGRTTGISEKVFENYPGFPGEPRWERLIAEDGKPLPAKKLEEQDRNRQKKAEAYARRLAAQPKQEHARQRQQYEEQQREQNEVVADIFRVYDVKMLRRESVEGHDTIVLSLTPRPGSKPRTREGREMSHFGVTAWLSESDFELVRLDVIGLRTLKIGTGVGFFARIHQGGKLTFVRRKINGEVWLPATSMYEGSARLGLVRVVRQRGESAFSNYRKFTVDTQSTFGRPPVKP